MAASAAAVARLEEMSVAIPMTSMAPPGSGWLLERSRIQRVTPSAPQRRYSTLASSPAICACHERLVGGLVLGMDGGHPVRAVLVRLGSAQQLLAVRALVGLVVGAVAVEPARVEVLLELDQQALDRLGAQQALVLAADVLDHADDVPSRSAAARSRT